MQKITDKELNQFYGVEVSQYALNEAIKDAKRCYDADDLSIDAHENFKAINAALADDDLIEAGCLLQAARQKSIARQATYLAYGLNSSSMLTVDQCFGEMAVKEPLSKD